MSIALAALLVLGLVFLMRDAEATEWLRKAIKTRADWARTDAALASETVGRKLRAKMPISRFLDALLSCAPCVAAWAAPPAAGLVYAVGQMNETAAALVFAFVLWPIASVGLLYAITILSPTQMVAMLLGAASRSKKQEAKKDAPEA